MKPMKKILFIIWSHSLGGGAESLLTTIVNHLNPQKYRIGILEVYHSTVKKEPVNPEIRIHEPITFEGDTEYRKKMYYIYRDPDRMIKKYIPAGYDLYISFNYQIPSFLLPGGGRNIAWVHGAVYDLAEEGMEDYRSLQGMAFEKAARIVSISDITTRSIRTLFPECSDRLVEIYNAVDIGAVRKRAYDHTEIRLEHPAVIWVGRLDDNKDPLRMVEIFQKLIRAKKSVHLYFIGKGELETQILKRIGECSLQKQVHVLGYIDNPFPVIRQAGVCCMTSRSEGFPMSLLECAALGIPFVSTGVGGARILANGERCGKIFKQDDEAVTDILELLGQSRDHLKEECAKSIERFDLKNYLTKIEMLFDEVLKENEDLREEVVRNVVGEVDTLEERNYYYRFPESLVPKGCKIVLYGAGDIGTNYFGYIKELGICQIVAWVDAAAEKYRSLGKDVNDVDEIMDVEYDVVLVAVMEREVFRSINRELSRRGIPCEKVLWTRPVF